jgi:hypothetical protein
VAKWISAECAARGLAVHGTINIEVQENWLTTTVDVTAAAFVVTTDRTGATTAGRPASGTGKTAAPAGASHGLSEGYRLKLCSSNCCRLSCPRAIMIG